MSHNKEQDARRRRQLFQGPRSRPAIFCSSHHTCKRRCGNHELKMKTTAIRCGRIYDHKPTSQCDWLGRPPLDALGPKVYHIALLRNYLKTTTKSHHAEHFSHGGSLSRKCTKMERAHQQHDVGRARRRNAMIITLAMV